MKGNRILEIDALRGLAALGVMLFHYFVAFRDQYSNASQIFPFFRYFRYGSQGVTLFFIISGFFILVSFSKKRSVSDFLFARFIRLYPAYWIAVVISSIVIFTTDVRPYRGLPNSWRETLTNSMVNMTMLQEFFRVPHIDAVYWTLSLELSFYIIVLILYKIKLLQKIDIVAFVWLASISTFFILESCKVLQVDSVIRILFLLDFAHLFILGISIFRVQTQGFSSLRFLTIIACLLFNLLKNGAELTLIIMLFTAAFILSLKGYLTFLKFKPLLFLGSISYSLYLIHVYPGLLIIEILEETGLNLNIAILTASITSIILATLITFYFEAYLVRILQKQAKRSQS